MFSRKRTPVAEYPDIWPLGFSFQSPSGTDDSWAALPGILAPLGSKDWRDQERRHEGHMMTTADDLASIHSADQLSVIHK